MSDARIPVIVGVGQINDRPATADAGLNPVELMVAALERADANAGIGRAGGWLAAIDALLVVDQISFRHLNPVVERIRAAIGARPRIARQLTSPTGDSPIRLLNDAANLIGAGEIEVAAVVGAEALRTAAALAATSGIAPRGILGGAARETYRGRYGLIAPVDVYPLYENASRAAYGQTLAEVQAESALIWSLLSHVAADSPGAWLRTPMTSAAIVTPSPANRPIAHPYTKLMVANSSVNQGAGFIVTSLSRARDMGVAEDRLVYVGLGAAAHEDADPLRRHRYDLSTSMAVSLTRTLDLNELGTRDLDLVELYSCFPCVPKMARRVIGWPADRPATVFGGLTFGGGPIGNYMSHAIAASVDRLRAGATNALLFVNGGYATENHSIVLTRRPQPAGLFPQDYDYQAQADAARGVVPAIDEGCRGPGTVETYTVLYDRAGAPRHGVIVGRNAVGARLLAKVPAEDTRAIAFLTDGATEPVGTRGDCVDGEGNIAHWRVSA